jgi:hypothetical protein
MTTLNSVYFTPYRITRAQAGAINSFSVRNTSTAWFNAAGIRTTRGSPQATSTQVSRLRSTILSALVSKAGQLRYVENSLGRAYGRNTTALNQAVITGTSAHNKIGLTFNGKTYKSLYNEYLTLMEAYSFTAGILRSWSRIPLY